MSLKDTVSAAEADFNKAAAAIRADVSEGVEKGQALLKRIDAAVTPEEQKIVAAVKTEVGKIGPALHGAESKVDAYLKLHPSLYVALGVLGTGLVVDLLAHFVK